MKSYKQVLLGAFLVISLGTAIVASAQDDSFSPEAKLLFEKILGGGTPTTTEGILKSLLDQQKKIKASGAFIEFDPESPGAEEEVEVRFVSYSFDVNSAFIYWTHNGKTVLAGRGEKIYRFTTGQVGDRESIALRAVVPGEDEFKTSKTFYIGGVDLLWGANTAIPPEYNGKALPSPRSPVYVTAFPQFILGQQHLSPASLIYEWSLDDKAKGSVSGVGKRTFSFYSSVAAGAVHEIGLKVYNANKTIVSKKTVSITVHNPEVLIYEEQDTGNPNIAPAIKSFSMLAGEEKKFRATPYFFSKNGLGDLSFSWQANNAKVREDQAPDVLSVKLADDAAGAVNISLLIESAKDIIQRAQASFVINIL